MLNFRRHFPVPISESRGLSNDLTTTHAVSASRNPKLFLPHVYRARTYPFSDASGVIHLIRRIRSAVRFV
jgi:hypothetical protein